MRLRFLVASCGSKYVQHMCGGSVRLVQLLQLVQLVRWRTETKPSQHRTDHDDCVFTSECFDILQRFFEFTVV